MTKVKQRVDLQYVGPHRKHHAQLGNYGPGELRKPHQLGEHRAWGTTLRYFGISFGGTSGLGNITSGEHRAQGTQLRSPKGHLPTKFS
ncbi:hypothetical protein ACOMHN_022719 [Nucella lapillus]